MTDKNQIIAVLRLLTELVERSSDAEIASLKEISLAEALGKFKASSAKPVKPKRSYDPVDVVGAIAHLNGVSSRSEGIAFLRGMSVTKHQMERIARQLDLPVMREDSSLRLIEKIVDTTVGPRLNSEAIRGA